MKGGIAIMGSAHFFSKEELKKVTIAKTHLPIVEDYINGKLL